MGIEVKAQINLIRLIEKIQEKNVWYTGDLKIEILNLIGEAMEAEQNEVVSYD